MIDDDGTLPDANPAAEARPGEPATDDVSERVRKMYNEFPFPSREWAVLNLSGFLPDALKRRLLRGGHMSQIPRVVREKLGDARGLRIADVGCGTGEITTQLAALMPEASIHGFDLTPNSLSRARELSRLKGLENIEFTEWNLMEGPPPGGPYDLVLCIGVLMVVPDPERGIRNLCRASHEEVLLWVYGQLGRWELIQSQELLNILVDDPMDFESKLRFAEILSLMPQRRRGKTRRLRKRIFSRDSGERESIWRVDQLANVHEVNYRYRELMELLGRADVELTSWLSGLPDDPAEVVDHPEALSRLRELPIDRRYEALELLLKPNHFCFFCRPLGP